MKYPWAALALAVVWLSTTYVILIQPELNVNYALALTLIATVIISFIGFRVPNIKK